ncbi:DUF501 domain-containing protein [Kushneria phosphatilytica]|uniref:DUF501 domain-containing protein n=1 Tax=Kushneria phosphatilytica TaxID=657387 RepID=A0A1S1NQJ5_9GAMM|nr:DUF501 domain-containing protein [Kushneria phosphatilytica]OHV10854.1 hypothetical protein BH688_08115 [Kushneria phosphatilytica]QEL12062.1 DUF501 domain-containing protein [Kushneria phosphatilytica]
MIQRTDDTPSALQLEIIHQQLGRTPRGLQAITAVDGQGTPLAVRVASLVDGKPFPTLYWLSSDTLRIEISRLEAEGVIKALEARLREDTALRDAYRRSHEAYIARRWQYIDDATRADIDAAGFTRALTERGVGGIADWQQVRCLHTQYAHHISDHNAIGEWIDQHYPQVAASVA